MPRMSRRSASRSVVGLILEIGFIAVVVTILPKLNLRPQAPADQRTVAVPETASPWWQADPAARATSWHGEHPAVNVEQTLQNASHQLLGSATDYASRIAQPAESIAAQDLLAEPGPSRPTAPEPQDWRRY